MDKFVFPVDFIILDMPEDIKTPMILGRLFLSTAHAKIDVFKRKTTLKAGDDKVVFKSDKPTSNIIKRVYALILREKMELDLEARLMGEALILNRSLDSLYEDYIKLNELNEPLELRRNQVDDLEPIIEEGEIVDEPMMDKVKTSNERLVVKNMDSYRDEGMDTAIAEVSAQDELKGISHPYQKLKGFYKEVLNLGPEYIKDEKVEEWITRGHVSVYEME
ncbi:hypothetical protein Tco_0356479 [Tanacetum coccineum]